MGEPDPRPLRDRHPQASARRRAGREVTAKSTAQRQAEKRARRAAEGLARLELFAHPDDHAAIKAYAARLQKRRAKPA